MKIRPSSLPKLQECPRFVGAPGNSPEAARGTRIDGIFRDLVAGQSVMESAVDPEELAAAKWAAEKAQELLQDARYIESREDRMRMTIEAGFIRMEGTPDCIGVPQYGDTAIAFCDLKSGSVRDYRAQMAAYSLGLMQQHWMQDAIAYLIFCDEKRIVTHRFSMSEALEMVGEIATSALDINAKPQLCEYCGWCANQTTCEARLQAVAVAENEVQTTQQDFKVRIEDPEFLGKFLTACSVVEDFRDIAKEKAKEILAEGKQVPGWAVSSRKGLEFVRPSDLAKHGLPYSDVLRACGTLSGKKARELWASLSGQPFPEEICETAASAAVLRAVKNKETKHVK